MRIIKIVWGVLALLITGVVVVVVVVVGFAGGESNMAEYCATVVPGTALQDIEASAREKGYRLHAGVETAPASGAYTAIITSSATMGRFICEVHHDGKAVVSARYIHND